MEETHILLFASSSVEKACACKPQPRNRSTRICRFVKLYRNAGFRRRRKQQHNKMKKKKKGQEREQEEDEDEEEEKKDKNENKKKTKMKKQRVEKCVCARTCMYRYVCMYVLTYRCSLWPSLG